MKYLKSFNESVIGFKPSEADKIKFLPGFEFYRMWSDLYGYTVSGKRMNLPMEKISIYKKDDKFFVEITTTTTKYSIDTQEFNDIESVNNYLINYPWYDTKTNENFRQEEVTEFMSIVREKLLELSDIGFTVEVEDKESEPLLENMIRITIKRDTENVFDENSVFKFSEVSDTLADILLTNIEMGPLYKKTHVIAAPGWRELRAARLDEIMPRSNGERLSWIFQGQECQWYYENPQIRKMTSLTPLNLDCKYVELFFE
jgi:hypothetical protein